MTNALTYEAAARTSFGARAAHDPIDDIEAALVLDKNFPSALSVAIEHAELISFDLFDTLLRRPFLAPAHLFDYLEEALAKPHFGAVRRHAEAAARVRHQAQHDVTVDQIYERFPIADDAAAEIAHEKLLLYPRRAIVQIFRRARSLRKKIAIVSDMYLDRGDIADILASHDLTPDFLIVSGSDQCAKGDASAFRNLIQRSAVTASKILHIGDNREADFAAPHRLGLKAAWIADQPVPPNRACKAPLDDLLALLKDNASLQSSIVGAAIRDASEALTVDRADDPLIFWKHIGAMYAGPMAYDFALWLRVMKRRLGLTTLAFVSRDGALPQQAYGVIDPASPTQYISLSRSSLVAACLDRQSDVVVNQLFSGPPVAPRTYLTRVGFSDPTILAEIDARFGVTPLRDAKQRSEFAKRLHQRRADFTPFAAEQRARIKRYLEQLGLFHNPESTAIIDIGWAGTSANILTELFPETRAWTFLYFGTRAALDVNHKSYSYAFDHGHPSETHEIAFSCIELPEFMFTAPHGTVIGYRQQGDKVVPIYSPPDDWTERAKTVEAIHQGARQTFDALAAFSSRMRLSFDKRTPKELLTSLILRQTLESGTKLAAIRHTVGPGSCETKPLVPPLAPPFLKTLKRVLTGRPIRSASVDNPIMWPAYAEACYVNSQSGWRRWLLNKAKRCNARGAIKLFGLKIKIRRRN